MNNKIVVVIPIAGKSTRFKNDGYLTHKAFLDINSKFILIEIINRFPKEIFTPCIVCTKNQFYEYKSYFEILLRCYPDLIIKEIEEHDLGPTYSVRQIEIEENIPVVVHYCDFLVDMDFLELSKNLRKGLICAPFFSGFHPASLGSTKFGYMKLNPNGYMITLKEKSSFTDNRIQEPCSTGIYAFPSFKIFKILADQLLASPNSWGQSESYTSLCLNLAIENRYKVFCQEVNKFICFGTPRDYKEYKYWEYILKRYYANNEKEKKYKHHIITAAGEGSRFKNYGYRIPKIFIDFDGKLLIEHAISSIKSEQKTVITLESYRNKIKKLKQYKFLHNHFLDKTPNGQLYTLFDYLSSNKIKDNFFVSSADYKFNLSDKNLENLIKDKDPDIIILTTPWNEFAFESPDNYGFISCTESDNVKEIIEKPKYKLKDEQLNSLLIGTFWFKSSEIINSLIKHNHSKDELFIAKTIGKHLSDFKVYKLNVNYWLSLGTPKELHLSEYWFDFFKNKYNK